MQSNSEFTKLRKFNFFMGILHFAQFLLILYLSNDTKFDLTTSFLKASLVNEKFSAYSSTEFLTSLKLGPLVALFLLISSIAHFLISTVAYKWYVENLKKGMNKARWIEYSISSSVMIVTIAILCGVYDAPTLILLFTINAMMILFGYMMELHNQTTQKTNWTSYIFGCIAGIVPWIVIAWYFLAAVNGFDGPNSVPDFVYGILISLFIFFNIFAINMFLQYKKIGPWKNYLFGERMYIVLSLVAKSALAWQVFSGTLR